MSRLRPFVVIAALATAQLRAAEVTIRVANEGWNGAATENIQKLLANVAPQFATNFPGRNFEPIFVAPGDDSPITLVGKTDRGEIRVRLTSRGNFWAQYSYQFAHEFCHICCHYEKYWDNKHPNQWFEESLCETASLFALRRMAETWPARAPYPSWKSFAPHLGEYADKLLKDEKRKLPAGVSLAAWFRENESSMRADGTIREKNAVVASMLLPMFEENPSRWEVVSYLNDSPKKPAESFADYLGAWRENAPRKYSAFIGRIAAQFGIEL